MLRKPGEYDPSRNFRPQVSNRRKTQEGPDDIVRKLQRLPGNKKCADCCAKLPLYANLTFGTFVCSSCSGILREFNYRIKGIGHSSFTPDEANFLRSHGNEVVNTQFLANFRHGNERLLQPDASMGPVDGQRMRTWLRAKYLDKSWYKGDSGNPSNHNGASSNRLSTVPVTNSSPRPTVAKIPPSQPAPAHDFLGGAVAAPTSTAASDAEWDAFGNSRARNTSFDVPAPAPSMDANVAFQADFSQMASMDPPPAPPTTQPPPPPPAQPPLSPTQAPNVPAQQPSSPFHANFNTAPPVPTSPNLPAQQTSSPFHANFNTAPPVPNPPNPPTQQASSPFHANFNTAPPVPTPQNNPSVFQANFDQTSPTASSGFQANFNQMPGAQPAPALSPPQTQFQSSQPFEAQFDQTNSSMAQTVTGQPIEAQPPLSTYNHSQQESSTLAQQHNISKTQESNSYPPSQFVQSENKPQVPSVASHAPPAVSASTNDFNNQVSSEDNKVGAFANFNAPSEPIVPSTDFSQVGYTGSDLQKTHDPSISITLQTNPSSEGEQNAEMNISGTTVSQLNNATNNSEMGEVLPQHVKSQGNGLESSEKAKESSLIMSSVDGPNAFDAFQNLSLNSKVGDEPASEIARDGNGGGRKDNNIVQPKYAVGQKVNYRDSRANVSEVEILKVHLDDDLIPFYEIKMPDGREKQTDDGHLSAIGIDNSKTASSGKEDISEPEEKHTVVEDIAKLLNHLDSNQLVMVKNFVENLTSGNIEKESPCIQDNLISTGENTKAVEKHESKSISKPSYPQSDENHMALQRNLGSTQQGEKTNTQDFQMQQQQQTQYQQSLGQQPVTMDSQNSQSNQWKPQQSIQIPQYQSQTQSQNIYQINQSQYNQNMHHTNESQGQQLQMNQNQYNQNMHMQQNNVVKQHQQFQKPVISNYHISQAQHAQHAQYHQNIYHPNGLQQHQVQMQHSPR